MIRLSILIGTAYLLCSGNALAKKTTTQDLMKRKLENAQALLEGLALENFDLILKSAQALREVGKAATWHKVDSPDYRHYANSFDNATHNMIEQANAKNLEGVAMSYIGLTFSCMQCHNVVRAGRPKP